MNCSHLLACQWLPLVTPGLATFTETCPQPCVRTSSVKEPRASQFVLMGCLNPSSGRYVRYSEKSFLAKEPSGISGMRSVSGWALNSWSRETTSPSVTLCTVGTRQ